jgi:UDP-N-acetylmuramate--alanine ligase
MIDLQKIKHIYFLGIGGIGMSALARYFKANGASVSGYDKTPTVLTDELIEEGIPVHYNEDVTQIPAATEFVVHTPAVPVEHAEYRYFMKHNIPVMKRSAVLGMITEKQFTIAVAGTHGKTSISTITALILKTAGRMINAFIGGIAANFGTNLLLDENADIVVAEADEFDRSFLQLAPDIAVISAMDPDHLDIYGSHEALKESFFLFAKKIKPGGTLIIRQGLDMPAGDHFNGITYGLTGGDFHAQNIRVVDGRFVFDIVGPQTAIREIVMQVPGRHNIENAIAAAAVCSSLGILPGKIKEALQSYKGVRRRFEFRVREKEIVFIDDYAHHPAELRACIGTARELFPGKRICGIFQPHLFTRTRDLADDFARALEGLDMVALMPIYPAREIPIPGITSEFLLAKINNIDKILIAKDELKDFIAGHDFEVLITMGAGDIDQCVETIEQLLTDKYLVKQ